MADFDDAEITELTFLDPDRLDAVASPANGRGWILLKSVAPAQGRAVAVKRSSKKDRKTAKHGLPYNAIRADKKVKRGRIARSAMTAKAASSGEIPATNCPNESASILAAVTGERSNGLCNSRTANGMPCRRPATPNGRCHLHA